MTIIHKERALESELSASQPAGRAREIFIGWLGRTKRKPHVEAQTDAHHAWLAASVAGGRAGCWSPSGQVCHGPAVPV